jgi:hypothetical protein
MSNGLATRRMSWLSRETAQVGVQFVATHEDGSSGRLGSDLVGFVAELRPAHAGNPVVDEAALGRMSGSQRLAALITPVAVSFAAVGR